MKKYNAETEQQMREFFATLSEKDRRRYAAIEANKVGYGGQSYMHRILGCSIRTVQRGQAELAANESVPAGRIRRPGGGRKPFDEKKKC